MAVRRPLKLDGSNNLKELTDSEINAIKNRARYLYGSDPSVTLSRVSSGGNLGTINDTRKQSGASAVRAGDGTSGNDGAAEYFPESSTEEPQTVTVGYARVSQSVASTSDLTDTDNVLFPLYYDSGNLRAMTRTDFYDTFVYPAIDTIQGSVGQPGTYRIHTGTSLSGYTAVSTSAIFSDTRANTGSFSASNIGTSGTRQDFPTTISNFYLLKANNISSPSIVTMVHATSSGHIQQFNSTAFDQILKNGMRHVAAQYSGTRIRFRWSFNGSGTNLGSGITNTILNGSGNYQTRFVNTNDYRAQEFPNGSATTASTTYLRSYQT